MGADGGGENDDVNAGESKGVATRAVFLMRDLATPDPHAVSGRMARFVMASGARPSSGAGLRDALDRRAPLAMTSGPPGGHQTIRAAHGAARFVLSVSSRVSREREIILLKINALQRGAQINGLRRGR
jgi:hypothetical protein